MTSINTHKKRTGSPAFIFLHDMTEQKTWNTHHTHSTHSQSGVGASYRRIKSNSSAEVSTGALSLSLTHTDTHTHTHGQGNPPKCLRSSARRERPDAADLRLWMSAAGAAVRLTLEGNPLLPVTSSHCSPQLRSSGELFTVQHGLNSHSVMHTMYTESCCSVLRAVRKRFPCNTVCTASMQLVGMRSVLLTGYIF